MALNSDSGAWVSEAMRLYNEAWTHRGNTTFLRRTLAVYDHQNKYPLRSSVSYACCLTESDGGFVLDPRSDHFIGMSSPIPSIAICVAYVPIVCWILPKFMQHKQPYDLRQLMMIYNFAMVLLSGYICLEVQIYRLRIYQNCRRVSEFRFFAVTTCAHDRSYATQIYACQAHFVYKLGYTVCALRMAYWLHVRLPACRLFERPKSYTGR